jgi:uncharacterized protein YndB with AHSA1/START domain
MAGHGIGHICAMAAVNQIDIDAPPDAVFDVLADPRTYARWVVGSRAVRAADREWPAPGSVFEHAQGVGPLLLMDSTCVLESERPSLLRMRVQARPISIAHVTLSLEPSEGGTHVVMREGPADLFSRLTMNPLTEPFMRLRNHESLKRLKRLAEGEEPRPEGDLPPRGHPAEGWVEASSRPATGR